MKRKWRREIDEECKEGEEKKTELRKECIMGNRKIEREEERKERNGHGKREHKGKGKRRRGKGGGRRGGRKG